MGKGKPNIIFILSDDQGVWASGCYGNEEIKTPNIDKLAKEGIKFENFFVVNPVCSPSRATFLTGKIPSQHGIHDWIRKGNIGKESIRYLEGVKGYTDILVENGYTCGISGKWHLGDSQNPQMSFTHWFVHQLGGGPYHGAPMVKEGKLMNIPEYITEVITDDAINFIEGNKDRPFYLSVHYTAPHSPWIGQHPEEFVRMYDDCPFNSSPQEPIHPWAKDVWLTKENLGNRESLKGYFAAVTAMDYNIGRILKKIKDLGLKENTLIVYASDNGFSCGHHGFWGKGNGTRPRNLYENSIKVPFIISHPGSLPEGGTVDALVSNYDFMFTLLDYLGLKMPEGNYPGRSFLPLLEGEEKSYHEFVVVFDEYGPVRMIRTKGWKYVHRYPDGPNELYNLNNDLDERENLIKESAYNKKVKELRGEMEEWFKKFVVPQRDGLLQNGFSDGQIEKMGG